MQRDRHSSFVGHFTIPLGVARRFVVTGKLLGTLSHHLHEVVRIDAIGIVGIRAIYHHDPCTTDRRLDCGKASRSDFFEVEFQALFKLLSRYCAVPPAKTFDYLSLRYALSCHKRSNFGDSSAGHLAYNLQNDLSSRVPVGNIKRGLVPGKRHVAAKRSNRQRNQCQTPLR
jgi:hypothetical protein